MSNPFFLYFLTQSKDKVGFPSHILQLATLLSEVCLPHNLQYGAIQQADYKNWIKPPVSVQNIHPVDPSCISKRASPPLAGEKTGHFCREPPKWIKTGNSDGRIAHGVGQNGPAEFKPNWVC